MSARVLVKFALVLASCVGVSQLAALATGQPWGPWGDRPAGRGHAGQPLGSRPG